MTATDGKKKESTGLFNKIPILEAFMTSTDFAHTSSAVKSHGILLLT
jgi:hypothetical protein